MDRGLKSTSGYKSGQYSLTSHKKFSQPNLLFKKKFAKSAFSHNFASAGEQMSTLWANGDKGYESTSGHNAAYITL